MLLNPKARWLQPATSEANGSNVTLASILHPPSSTETKLPQLNFAHAGITRTLNKHPTVQNALRAGTITEEQAKLEAWQLRLKINGRERYFKLPTADRDAIRTAKDILNGRTKHADEFTAFMAQRDARRSVTLGQLATAWIAAGLQFSKTKPREKSAADRLEATLNRALPFWKDLTPTTITATQHEDYVLWRRNNVRCGTHFKGDRSADLELGALSSMCQWAILTGRLKENPFATRSTFATEVKHCHESMPAGDDQFHQILTWLIQYGGPLGPGNAAYLAFCALSGLRPGEPAALQYCRPLRGFPTNFETALPGQIYRTPDGTWRMKVHRLKNGQNPAILIHPALRDFLCTWRAYHRKHFKNLDPTSRWLFPNSTPHNLLDSLHAATTALGLPAMKPHGFGRAYYVRVRRSQGADDTTIAVELGQTTNGKLIRSTYGDPTDPVGGNRHDWLPAGPAKAAWKLFSSLTPPTRPADTSSTRPAASKV